MEGHEMEQEGGQAVGTSLGDSLDYQVTAFPLSRFKDVPEA